MGKVSVIIPTFNRKSTILRAIESALAQSASPFEILVCDDGSTDETKEQVVKIKDKRIKWIPGKHAGVPAVPRNAGISESRGEWIAFLDSDDWWFPTKLEKQLAFAQQSDFLAVSSNAALVRQQDKLRNILDYPKNKITFSSLIATNYVICSTALIHKSLFTACLGFPEDINLQAIEDYALWLRIATQTSFGYIGEPLAYYNDDTQSVRAKGPQTLIEQKERVYKNFLQWVKKKNSLTNFRKEVETAYSFLHS